MGAKGVICEANFAKKIGISSQLQHLRDPKTLLKTVTITCYQLLIIRKHVCTFHSFLVPYYSHQGVMSGDHLRGKEMGNVSKKQQF